MKSHKWSEQKLTSRFIVVELNSHLLLENYLSYQKRSDQKLDSSVNFRLLKRFRGYLKTYRNGDVFATEMYSSIHVLF